MVIDCRFCGQAVESTDLLHVLACDGRQGRREADLAAAPEARYPHAAGWKEPTTSQEAAETIDAKTVRQAVRRCLATYGAMTADECATRLTLSILTIRPRFSELRALGEVDDTGQRHANRSGKRAIVWALTESSP